MMNNSDENDMYVVIYAWFRFQLNLRWFLSQSGTQQQRARAYECQNYSI